MTIDVISSLLGSDRFFAKEEVIWERCVEWSKYNVNNNYNDKGKWQDKMQIIKYNIRFTLINSKYFVQHIAQSNVLTMEEAFNLSLKMHDKSHTHDSLSNFNFSNRIKSQAIGSMDWHWTAEGPPTNPTKQYYSLSNHKKTIKKAIDGNHIIVARVAEWIEHVTKQIFTVRLDSIVTNIDQYHRIGIIGESYWKKCYYLNHLSDCPCLELSLYDGKITKQKTNVLAATNHKFVQGNVIQFTIDGKEQNVTIEIFANDKQAWSITSHTVNWNEMTKEKMCFALSVRSTEWQLTIIKPISPNN